MSESEDKEFVYVLQEYKTYVICYNSLHAYW